MRRLASSLPIALALAAFHLSAPPSRPAQPPPRPAQESAPHFRSGVNVVEVYATATNARGELVTDLRRDEFEVDEDGVPQRVTLFAAGEFPLSVAIAIDHSASMAGERLAMAQSAARVFLRALSPGDRAMIVAVSSLVQVVAPLSTDREQALRAVDSLRPWSTTSLYDAIITGIDLVQPGEGRRALVLLSDGQDRYSGATAAEVLDRARHSDVLVYPVAIGKEPAPLFPELAATTGGRSFQLRSARDLPATLSEIAKDLRFQYLLGYSAPLPRPGTAAEWRAISVSCRRAGVRIRARDGYYVG
jgi:Ca-activated chloride channel homolog